MLAICKSTCQDNGKLFLEGKKYEVSEEIANSEFFEPVPDKPNKAEKKEDKKH